MKVTGGGTSRGAVAAHFAYISRRGSLEIETDEGERIGRLEEQRRLIDDWHLELTAGQYRTQRDGGPARRPTKLVHNIVLSMPAPTPRTRFWPPRGNSPARISGNIATPWCCTPTSSTRTCIWW